MTEPIVPEPGTRLAQLVSLFASLKPDVEDYTERFKATKDGIKSEMSALRPGETTVTLTSDLLEKPLKLSAKTSNRVDTKLLKDIFPEVYDYVLKPTTAWELRQ